MGILRTTTARCPIQARFWLEWDAKIQMRRGAPYLPRPVREMWDGVISCHGIQILPDEPQSTRRIWGTRLHDSADLADPTRRDGQNISCLRTRRVFRTRRNCRFELDLRGLWIAVFRINPGFRSEGFHDRLAHRRQLVLDRIPDDLVIYIVVTMPQDVAHAAKTLPIGSGA